MGQGEARGSAEHRAGSATGRQPQAGPRPATAERHHRGGRPLTVRGPRRARRATGWQALLWLGPSLALIGAVVAYPAALLIRASLSQYSVTGLYQGSVGLRNYARLLRQEALTTVVADTLVWVTVIVVVTLMLSLGLAQFLDKSFPGRRLVRWALIVPWAASLIMTSKLFVWIYDYYFGILNPMLQSLGVLHHPVDWLGDDSTVMGAMITVGIFVSLPFTTYVWLAAALGVVNVLLILLAVLVYLRSVRWRAQEA